jgi:hypothetical protein
MRGPAYRLSIFTCFSALVTLFWIVCAHAQPPTIVCQPLSGDAPTIDGAIGIGEWPATPNLTLDLPNYPIETNFTCVYDLQHLYVLVDAVGDTTESNWDECLLVFDLPPSHKIVEIWKSDTDIVHRFDGGSSGQSEMGFGGHRVYEFMINLGSIGLQRGRAIAFFSPAEYKGPGSWASMPFDNESPTRDNIFPYDLQVTPGGGDEISSVTGYATLVLYNTGRAPALSPVGMICVALLLAAMGVRLLHRRRHGSAG